jgi:hypothetical protein
MIYPNLTIPMTKKYNKISRRDFIKQTLCVLIIGAHQKFNPGSIQAGTHQSVIVRVHDQRASKKWDYSLSAPWDHTSEPHTLEEMRSQRFRQDRYYDFIDEDVVGNMFRRGLLEVTDTKRTEDAWRKILKNYKKYDKITLKINLNNASYDERITTNRLDQTAPLINSIIFDLVNSFNVPEETITVADPSRWIHPKILKERCPFKKVTWVDSRSSDLWDPAESVIFTKDKPLRPDIANLPEKVNFYLARVYTDAKHIINVCLMKNHGCGITGAMKNHFGAIPPFSPKFLHTGLGEKSYIADLCNTKSIREKVRLNVCDAVFANWHGNVWSPRPWMTFSENSPNSIFLGVDPVAFDSVLLQHIADEVVVQGENAPEWVRERIEKHQFLHYAMEYHNLGIHEHKPFNRISYRQIENTLSFREARRVLPPARNYTKTTGLEISQS